MLNFHPKLVYLVLFCNGVRNNKELFFSHSFFAFSSVSQSCPTLCDPMNCRTPGLPFHHQLPEFTQTQVHRVGDGQGGLAFCGTWDHKELDNTERLN